MSEDETDPITLSAALLVTFFVVVIAAQLAAGSSLQTDTQVLLNLRSFLESENPVYEDQAKYIHWNSTATSPCNWPGIACSGGRVAGINLSGSNIGGNMFGNFSALTELSYLDLSENTIGGPVPEDLSHCFNLNFLNLSHNIMYGQVNLTGLSNLEILDLSVNRIQTHIRLAVPSDCGGLVVANVSDNNFTGSVGNAFQNCHNLRYLDLSVNALTGELWAGVDRLEEVSLSENNFSGSVPGRVFSRNCNLRTLDLSDNLFAGEFPPEISGCRNLKVLNLGGNNFTGQIPEEIGHLKNVEALYLGTNRFSPDIPASLLSLTGLMFLDLSRNEFGGEIQPIFGQFTQVRFLLLHHNSYTGGLYTSGVLTLPNVSRLDLSFNDFTGPLPVKFSQLPNLKFLVLAYNQFNGTIPSEYGNFAGIQALDLSFNNLTGSIPPSLGRLTSLLWLMLANNKLSGEIPRELGGCSSLLWLNLANNLLSGSFPPQLTRIGSHAGPTFTLNRRSDLMPAGSGECLAMKRWIPVDYPPFSFVYKLLTRKKCRVLWDRILKGYGLFPVCSPESNIRTTQLSGYIQLSGNRFSGEIPVEIGKMRNFSMLQLGHNQFTGKLPSEIGYLPLIVINVSRNNFSGEIPSPIGNLKCLQNLDLSYNNFSGAFPDSLKNLSDLTAFNISYNPFVSGDIPSTGQLSTMEKWPFLGDPLLRLPSFITNTTHTTPIIKDARKMRRNRIIHPVFIVMVIVIFGTIIIVLIICFVVKTSVDSNSPGYLLNDSSTSSSPWLSNEVKVIRLNKTPFTHQDILKATGSFSDERIIGRGGSGTVYKGVLPDGREVAVKKLQTEGINGEREFRAEMEVLSGEGFHPNLVPLYGWCLAGSEKLLVYEYMNGGSLEDLITDRQSFNWRRRLEVALDVAGALVFLHHECFPSIVHRDVKASNVLLDKIGRARITDFGLARVFDYGRTHVSTMVAGTVGYVAPEYSQTWQATTRGDVYSYGVLALELATGRRALDGGDECLVEWVRRAGPSGLWVGSGFDEGAEKMVELLRVGIWCTSESPNLRPNMKEVSAVLFGICCIGDGHVNSG